ncbi:MAG TPA: HD domain-containing phosphohydrolase, partial [Gemmatimonadaceae bacterium]|nr:HD domain-containing phosphohydrolase [Gemmatimonadaceae bacterium]
DVRFTRAQMRELRFAALLHDLGKVAVREDVLIKAKKLPPELWERVRARFALIRRTMEVEYLRKRASLLLDTNATLRTRRLDDAYARQLERLERVSNVVRAANEPTVDLDPLDVHLAEIVMPEHLAEIATQTFESADATEQPYLTADELRFLQIPHGTLDDRERTVIESHVDQTYRFLAQIPWTDDLKNLPIYAGMHHEKLDGTGYPRRVKGKDIPIQSRMITIADIFDALTESDRPYRRAMPLERALDLLQSEAKAGQLDSELVRIMIESQVYRKVLDEDWKRL